MDNYLSPPGDFQDCRLADKGRLFSKSNKGGKEMRPEKTKRDFANIGCDCNQTESN